MGYMLPIMAGKVVPMAAGARGDLLTSGQTRKHNLERKWDQPTTPHAHIFQSQGGTNRVSPGLVDNSS